MKIIIGLGNPKKKHEKTRHNIGFVVLDRLAERENLKWQHDKKINADIIKSQEMFLIKPATYMNNSGQAVLKILDYYDLLERDEEGKLLPTDLSEILTVIHDDLDIELGKYKISVNSSSAGHKGVQSIIDAAQTQNFARVRIGIKTEKLEKMPGNKFVLKKLPRSEMKIINEILPKILANF
ncbi:MAG: aminoacyl-tRNA hydrolase [bacterium]